MIYIKLNGRLGNYLFQIAAGASLAHQIDSEYQVIIADDSESIYIGSSQTMAQYIKPFQNSIFRKVPFTQRVNSDTPVYSCFDFAYKPLPTDNQDIILSGYFQSYRYIDPTVVRSLYAIPEEIDQSLRQKYKEWIDQPFICVHVRRGDYLNLPHRFSICSIPYFQKAMQKFDGQIRVAIISDDIRWCKKHLKGDNIVYADRDNTILEDLYLQTLAEGNIISNSSFSWWGAYLNSHPDKKVYYPTPWFGPHNSHHDTSDLCPPSWVAIPNQTPLYYRLKSAYLRIKMKFQ